MASRTHLKFLDAYGVSKFQNMGSRGHFPLSLVTWGKQVIHSSNGLSHTQKGKMNWTNSYFSNPSESNLIEKQYNRPSNYQAIRRLLNHFLMRFDSDGDKK